MCVCLGFNKIGRRDCLDGRFGGRWWWSVQLVVCYLLVPMYVHARRLFWPSHIERECVAKRLSQGGKIAAGRMMLFPLMFLSSIYFVARQKTKLSASFHERLGVDT